MHLSFAHSSERRPDLDRRLTSASRPHCTNRHELSTPRSGRWLPRLDLAPPPCQGHLSTRCAPLHAIVWCVSCYLCSSRRRLPDKFGPPSELTLNSRSDLLLHFRPPSPAVGSRCSALVINTGARSAPPGLALFCCERSEGDERRREIERDEESEGVHGCVTNDIDT